MVPFAVVVAVAASKPLHQVARLKRFLLNGMILVIRKKSLCVSAKNDEKATALVTRSAQAIANLIADLKIGLDMQKVVVGGSVGLAEGYLPLVQSLLSELPAVYHCELESAQFGQDAGLIGAAYWVKDCLLQAKNTGVVYG